MIDCIMLLLLFFLLTTQFVSPDKQISLLLPDTKGQLNRTVEVVEKVEANIRIYPAGLEGGLQPSAYEALLQDVSCHKAVLRIGRREPLEIDFLDFQNRDSKAVQAQVERVHRYIADALLEFENAESPSRASQPPISIHCYSGLPWAFALLAYDACRNFENSVTGELPTDRSLDNSRVVNLSAPTIRDATAHQRGQELFEIIHLR